MESFNASIEDWAFGSCKTLKEVIIPDGVTRVGDFAFCESNALRGVSLPASILDSLMDLKGVEYQRAVLGSGIWSVLEPEQQMAFYMKKLSKDLIKEYEKSLSDDQVDPLGEAMRAKLQGKCSAKECNAMATYITSLYSKLHTDILFGLYNDLKLQKNGAKAVSEIESNSELMPILQKK